MLYLATLAHQPGQCPGVSLEIRDRVLRMAEMLQGTLAGYGCAYRGGWVAKSPHLTYLLLDAPDAHAVDNAIVDLGLAVWNTAEITPVITLDEAVGGLPE